MQAPKIREKCTFATPRRTVKNATYAQSSNLPGTPLCLTESAGDQYLNQHANVLPRPAKTFLECTACECRIYTCLTRTHSVATRVTRSASSLAAASLPPSPAKVSGSTLAAASGRSSRMVERRRPTKACWRTLLWSSWCARESQRAGTLERKRVSMCMKGGGGSAGAYARTWFPPKDRPRHTFKSLHYVVYSFDQPQP